MDDYVEEWADENCLASTPRGLHTVQGARQPRPLPPEISQIAQRLSNYSS